MEHNIEQHHAFLPGLEAFGKYAQACLKKEQTFDAKHFLGLMDAFAPVLSTHLKDEIDTLRSLGKYDVQAIKKSYMALAADATKQSKVGSSLYRYRARFTDFLYRQRFSPWCVAPAIRHSKVAAHGLDSPSSSHT